MARGKFENGQQKPLSPALRTSPQTKRTIELNRTMNSDSESEFSHSESEQSPPFGPPGSDARRKMSPRSLLGTLREQPLGGDDDDDDDDDAAEEEERYSNSGQGGQTRRDGRRLSLSPVTHDLGEGGDGDGGDDDERETSPVAEAQIETWLASAAAEEAANLGGSSAEANSSPKPTSLAVLREDGEGDDESEGGMVDLLETPASLLPFPGSSPPPTLTPMRQPVADWPGTAAAGGDGWPNNTRAYSQQPAKPTAYYYWQLVARVSDPLC